MKILLSNKFYYRRGGDCIYMLSLEQLLKAKGHDVAIFAMDFPDNIDTPWSKYFPSEFSMRPGWNMLESLRRPFGSSEVKDRFNKLLDDFQPDVVHLNNIHTQLSPVIAEIAHERGIRVVWTLHDYKLLCPRYDCLRNDNMICEECFANKKNVLQHRCMKNSLIASIIAYKEAMCWNGKRLECCTDQFICPSQFIADKMKQGGFAEIKLTTLCNFIDIKKCKREDYSERENYYCYVGRLSNEKGVRTLVEAAKRLPYKLVVIGDGPLKEKLQKHHNVCVDSQVEFVGYKDWNEIKELVGHAKFSVIPSEWYENNPLSVIESECLGTPVLGANTGGIPELIDKNMGRIFESGNIEDLTNKINDMWNINFNYNEIAHQAQQKYNSEAYYVELMKIYSGKE